MNRPGTILLAAGVSGVRLCLRAASAGCESDLVANDFVADIAD